MLLTYFSQVGRVALPEMFLDMRLEVCDATQKEIDNFPDDGTLSKYLDAKGLYPSTTYLYLRSKPWSLCEGMQSLANASTATPFDLICQVCKLEQHLFSF